MDVLALLRVIVARDGAAPPVERWDAAAWEAVHAAVIAWDAAPLAASSMRAAGLARFVPAPIFEAWRRDHTGTTAVNMRLSFEAGELVMAIGKLGGHATMLKGTALFEIGAYRDPGARPTSDIDLLVTPESAGAVERAMAGKGYTQWQGGGPKHWPPFQRDGLLVEVHEHAFWSLADGHRVRLAEMVDARGKPAIAMVVAHLVHHLFESSVTSPWLVVKTLADLAEVRAFVMARADGDEIAGEIGAAAERLGLAHRLGALAGLLAKVIEREVPDTWIRRAKTSDVDDLIRRAAPRSKGFETALRLPDRLAAIARMPAAEKVARLRHYLLPPVATMRLFYGLRPGSPWVYALYPLRPLHLFGRSALDAARLAIEAGRRSKVDPAKKKA